MPTKKTLYILIACIISLVSIFISKNISEKTISLIALETGTSSKELSNTDEISFVTGQTNIQKTNILGSEGNLTESFAQGVFSKYYTNTGDTGLNQTDSLSLINDAVTAYSSVSLDNAPKYSIQDLKIVATNDSNIRNFSNSFAVKEESCLKNIQITAKKTEDPIQTGDLYKNCANTLLTIPIVQEINSNYLDLVNNYYLTGEKIFSLEASKSDPLKAIITMKEIGELDTQKKTYYQNISSFIKRSGIIFSNEEPGKIWLGTIQ